jgi:hypothetical protein
MLFKCMMAFQQIHLDALDLMFNYAEVFNSSISLALVSSRILRNA